MPRSRLSRRSVLASLGVTPVVSALAGASPSAGDAVPQTESVLSAVLNVSLVTPADATVGSAIILGGVAQGELAGAVQPGSLEWTRDPVRGVLQLAMRFELQARPGLRIHVADRATVVTPTECWAIPFATTPELTVVDGASAACREAVYLGRMDASQIQSGQLRLTVHRVL
jgi:hypothetical protein